MQSQGLGVTEPLSGCGLAAKNVRLNETHCIKYTISFQFSIDVRFFHKKNLYYINTVRVWGFSKIFSQVSCFHTDLYFIFNLHNSKSKIYALNYFYPSSIFLEFFILRIPKLHIDKSLNTAQLLHICSSGRYYQLKSFKCTCVKR